MEACVGANHPSRKLMAFGHGAIDACALLDDFRDAKAKAAAAGLWGDDLRRAPKRARICRQMQ